MDRIGFAVPDPTIYPNLQAGKNLYLYNNEIYSTSSAMFPSKFQYKLSKNEILNKIFTQSTSDDGKNVIKWIIYWNKDLPINPMLSKTFVP